MTYFIMLIWTFEYVFVSVLLLDSSESVAPFLDFPPALSKLRALVVYHVNIAIYDPKSNFD